MAAELDQRRGENLQKTNETVLGIARKQSTYGVYVAETNFEALWAKFRPHEKIPADLSTATYYRLEPLPAGCDVEAVNSLLQQFPWRAHAIHALGKHAFKVAALEPPGDPCGRLAAMGHKFLATPLVKEAARELKKPFIIAGAPGFARAATFIAPVAPLTRSTTTAIPTAPAGPPVGPMADKLAQVVGDVDLKFKNQQMQLDALKTQLQTTTTELKADMATACSNLKVVDTKVTSWEQKMADLMAEQTTRLSALFAGGSSPSTATASARPGRSPTGVGDAAAESGREAENSRSPRGKH